MSDVPVISLFDSNEEGDDFFSKLAPTSPITSPSSATPLQNSVVSTNSNSNQNDSVFSDESSETSFFESIASSPPPSITSSIETSVENVEINNDVVEQTNTPTTTNEEEEIKSKEEVSSITKKEIVSEDVGFSFGATGTEEESFFDQLSKFPETPIASANPHPTPQFSQTSISSNTVSLVPPQTTTIQPPVNVFAPTVSSASQQNFFNQQTNSLVTSAPLITPPNPLLNTPVSTFTPSPVIPPQTKVFTPSVFPNEEKKSNNLKLSPMGPPPPSLLFTPTPLPSQTPSVFAPSSSTPSKIFTPNNNNNNSVNVFTPNTNITPSPISTAFPPNPISPPQNPTPFIKPPNPFNVFTPSTQNQEEKKPFSTMKPPAPQIFTPNINNNNNNTVLSPQSSRLRPSNSSSVSSIERGSHPIVSFGFGGKLVTMFPRKRMKIIINNPNGPVEAFTAGAVTISNLGKQLQNSDFYKSMNTFPGPLNSSSAKDKVIQFINERIASSKLEYAGLQQQDTVILWEILKILCNNYGSLSNTEGGNAQQLVKDLLLQENNEYQESPFRNPSSSANEAQQLVQLQKYILSGKLEEGYKYAVANGLWSHALILATSLGGETFRNTVQLFSENSLQEGAPVRTMYLLFSGKIRELFSHSVSSSPTDNTPGQQIAGLLSKWRDNIAVVLANRNPNDNNSKAIIGEIGDKLWMFQRRAEAAHF